jgi:hypothetical protein
MLVHVRWILVTFIGRGPQYAIIMQIDAVLARSIIHTRFILLGGCNQNQGDHHHEESEEYGVGDDRHGKGSCLGCLGRVVCLNPRSPHIDHRILFAGLHTIYLI